MPAALGYPLKVPNATNLDFRGLVAFSADEAFLMSAGPGDQSRIYHTFDAGQHWQLQFTSSNPKAFFDSIAFWDPTHGIVLGDPVPDDSGQLKFQLLITTDGQSWIPIPPSQLPPALEGEGAFAASNTCLTILGERSDLESSSGSLLAAKPPASSIPLIAAARGKSSTLPSPTAPIPQASSLSPSAMPITA